MGLFRHPHLVRGIVHTSKGGFLVTRGIVDVPDVIGESFGWSRLPDEHPEPTAQSPAPASTAGAALGPFATR
jgi:hypothetical protein